MRRLQSIAAGGRQGRQLFMDDLLPDRPRIGWLGTGRMGYAMVSQVVEAGRLSIVASGPPDAYAAVRPYLSLIGWSVTYAGEGEVARLVKLCHNVFLGVVTQALAEVTVLAEKGGVSRAAFLDFLNG